MAFSVEPDDLDAYGKQLRRAAEDVEQAREYVKKYCEMMTMDVGPISSLAEAWDGGHKDTVSRVDGALSKLEKIISNSSEELLQSSTYYSQTDQTEARKIDSTYPASKR